MGIGMIPTRRIEFELIEQPVRKIKITIYDPSGDDKDNLPILGSAEISLSEAFNLGAAMYIWGTMSENPDVIECKACGDTGVVCYPTPEAYQEYAGGPGIDRPCNQCDRGNQLFTLLRAPSKKLLAKALSYTFNHEASVKGVNQSLKDDADSASIEELEAASDILDKLTIDRPWYSGKAGNDSQCLIIEGITGRTVAVTYDCKDAAVISAAPELKAALQAYINLDDDIRSGCKIEAAERSVCYQNAMSVMAKAKGE